jgi:hypothetical protein
MTLEILPFNSNNENIWDDFVNSSVNATFLHSRKFLNYHGDRFKDVSILIFNSNRLVGVFPASEATVDKKLIISHPGITYGGIIHNGWLNGGRMIDAFIAISKYYSETGYQRLQYKAVPFIYSTRGSQDDLYALFRMQAIRMRCDLSCTIDLLSHREITNRRKRNLKKSHKHVIISKDPLFLGELWEVIKANLASRHKTTPVHSLHEITFLKNQFPDNISIYSALIDGIPQGGVIFFNSPLVWHAQYIAANQKAMAVSALDSVFEAAILDALKAGVRYFDFGTSNEKDGYFLNENLYRYKSEFGGGGVVYEVYEVQLNL